MMLSAVAPRTTRVVNRAPAPSAARAAAAVASLAVEAGVESWLPCSDSSTRPVDGSATMADTCGPSAAADSGPASADRSPLAVGSGPLLVPPVRTAPPPTTGPPATEATLSAASRGGSMRTTARPATSVNTLITASVSRAATRVRRTMTNHLA